MSDSMHAIGRIAVVPSGLKQACVHGKAIWCVWCLVEENEQLRAKLAAARQEIERLRAEVAALAPADY